MRQATRTQWIKCTIAILLYLAFLIWVRSWWGLIVVPFIFDIYITKKIPWSFWKKSKNPTVRNVMSWVDAIVFALVAVYFVNIYIFQNYQIPSSSLEKSLLVGDFLYVSKMSYGPRVPNTPLSMPLAQHTLPILNTKSYIEWPQWKYKRVPGFGKVKLNDIVVFNFPAGDTVALNNQQTDFYSIAYGEGQRLYPKQIEMDSLTRQQQRAVYDLYYNAGRQQILSNPRVYGEVVYRPVDRRENYVKRCVGLPGDTLQIVDGQVMIDGKAIENPENLQFNYFVQTTGPYITEDMFRELGISKADQTLYDDSSWEETFRQIGLDNRNAQGKMAPIYHLPLTKKMYETLSGNKKLISKIVMEPEEYAGQMYPLNLHTKWNRNNYGPIWIPAKGATITLTEDNLPIYERCIVAYEGNKLEIKPDGIYVDGTLGGGGHAYEVCRRLNNKGSFIGIDQDAAAIEAAGTRLSDFGERVTIIRSNYCDMKSRLHEKGIDKVDGIVLDLGVSSYQLDTADRGFSYRVDAPLDMRMDTRQTLSAKEIVNGYSEMDLFRIIRDYGEDKFAKNIAKHIVMAREKGPIETTGQLAEIIRQSIPMKFQKMSGHPAKRTFQAIRIECNRELEVLRDSLDDMIDILNPGGRICIITFHSLEDRIVKGIFKKNENPCTCPSTFPVCVCGKGSKGKVITKKPILPSEEEMEVNSRSKSAKLRIFERV